MRGPTKPYPEFVLKERIQIDPPNAARRTHRYLLKIPFSANPKRTLAVILKNPSAATDVVSDHTVNRVLNYAFRHHLEFDQVIIVNLFGIYAGTPKLLFGRPAQHSIGNGNDRAIRRALREANYIVVAWGGPSGTAKPWVGSYQKRIKQVLQLLEPHRVYYVKSVSRNGPYPLHAQVWGYEYEMKEFNPKELISARPGVSKPR